MKGLLKCVAPGRKISKCSPVFPVLTYAYATWATKYVDEKRHSFEKKVLRKMYEPAFNNRNINGK